MREGGKDEENIEKNQKESLPIRNDERIGR